MTTIRKTGITEYRPAVAARPYQPYIPPTPAWTEYRRVESCTTELPTTTWVTKIELVVTPFFDAETGTWSYTGIYKSVPSQSTVPGKQTCSFSTVQIYHPASPGQPYLPGQAAMPARVVEDRRPGWNSGAVSVRPIDGEGGYTFSAPVGVVGVVVGLTTSRSPTHPSEISHGLYLTRGMVQRMESGSPVGSAQSYTASDVLAIQRRSDGVVVYLTGSTEIGRSSGAPVTGPMSLGEVMYLAGDAVVNAKCEYVLGISVSGDMPPLAGSASDYAAATSLGSMRQLRPGPGSASSARMRPAQGLASNRPYASVSGQFVGMSGAAYGPTVTPSTGIVGHSLFPMHGFSTGVEIVPTTVSGLMTPLGGLSSDRQYGDVKGAIAPLNGFASGRNMHNVMDAAITASARSAYGVMSPSVLNGGEISSTSGAVSGWLGGHAKLTAIKRSVSGSASSIGVMRGALVAVTRTMSGTGRISFVARGTDIIAKPGAVSGRFGSSGSISAQQRSVSGSFIPGGVGRGAIRMLAPSVSGVVTEQAWCYGALVAKAGYITQGGRAELIRAQAVVAGGLSAQKTVGNAYAVVLDHSQDAVASVTRYTSYPFVGMARFNGKNYGVSADGLYELNADTDDGQAIAWSFTMSAGDFNKHVKKNIASTHFSGVLGSGQAQFSVKSDQDATYMYTPDTSCVGKNKNHRVKFGRGSSDRFAAIGVSGYTRSSFNTIGFEVLESKRRI